MSFIEIQCDGPDDCSNQGICDILTGTCACTPGFQGDICQGKTIFKLTSVHSTYLHTSTTTHKPVLQHIWPLLQVCYAPKNMLLNILTY